MRSLVFHRIPITQGRVPTMRVIPALNPLKHGRLGFRLRLDATATQQLTFQRREEAPSSHCRKHHRQNTSRASRQLPDSACRTHSRRTDSCDRSDRLVHLIRIDIVATFVSDYLGVSARSHSLSYSPSEHAPGPGSDIIDSLQASGLINTDEYSNANHRSSSCERRNGPY
jgi:hypothetical protein